VSDKAADDLVTFTQERQIGTGRNKNPRAALNSPSGAMIADRFSSVISFSTSAIASLMTSPIVNNNV
jgi:hypothetical protein